MNPPFTPGRIALLLLFYAALGAVMSLHGRKLTKDERKTFLLLWGAGFSIALVSNYLLFRIGAMTFLPWINNFLHTFFWIGLGFPYLYFGTRGRSPVVVFTVFLVLSLIVKYAEQLLFGTWDGTSFLGLIPGNFGYILGWSAVDGCLPFVMALGLRLVGKFVPGLVTE
jgi:hypothetical protein